MPENQGRETIMTMLIAIEWPDVGMAAIITAGGCFILWLMFKVLDI